MLEKATDIIFFDDNAAIIEAQDSIDTLYIIIKGMVKEIDASGEILALYHPSDSFDTRALFGQSYRHSFIAVEQSLLYAMPKTIIRTLIEENSEFSAYFFANIADKLKNRSDNRRENELAGLFTAKVRDAYRSYDELYDGSIGLIDAAKIMQINKSKSLLIHHDGKIIVNNPSWCQSVSEFKQTVGSWYKNPTPDHMMNLAIFMDAKSVSGDEALLKEVRTHLSGYLDSDVGMLMSFARAVNQFDEDGHGFFAQILGHKSTKWILKNGNIPCGAWHLCIGTQGKN
ncbi:hypothetical protein D6E01_06080 [Moraxella catarrhalis]|uniref:cyclic nucleotide-binding domain-containing protein n=1 Tax=Moraxella catarrhalis TaxID=480 RepID=UPI000EA877B9|nr:cyclic nucleotide-binding domain-containing protein [Moraxella catarrhalis]RKL83431.1 hypothetical protein D6E01_06080 [Moraxella catarrhalis]RKM00173.1 hypothetical protein D6D58_08500 [Moraxella catarrhalis]